MPKLPENAIVFNMAISWYHKRCKIRRKLKGYLSKKFEDIATDLRTINTTVRPVTMKASNSSKRREKILIYNIKTEIKSINSFVSVSNIRLPCNIRKPLKLRNGRAAKVKAVARQSIVRASGDSTPAYSRAARARPDRERAPPHRTTAPPPPRAHCLPTRYPAPTPFQIQKVILFERGICGASRVLKSDVAVEG
ncbi:hypothetical protein O3G_MSEX006651 [Manduca sexta]|uniref:Uncharacterized protein n=1 Tax=Manduca sexta TaxID=7130 RepID=A0A921Z483_MANSE|nr:hypothetical protein O3G_MSEX006651 [Manduca sexta]